MNTDNLIDWLRETLYKNDDTCNLCLFSPINTNVNCGGICSDERADEFRQAIIERFCVGADIVQKEGYWIYLDNDELRYDSYRCSSCNRSITVDAERKDDIGFIIEDMKYCPNCGARMIEVKS